MRGGKITWEHDDDEYHESTCYPDYGNGIPEAGEWNVFEQALVDLAETMGLEGNTKWEKKRAYLRVLDEEGENILKRLP